MGSTPNKLLVAVLLATLAQASHAGSELYCCQNAQGRSVCGDSLPDQCRGRAYRILDSGGNVIREVGKALTPEEQQAHIAEEKQRKQQEEAAREQRRRDQALLDTYATLQDIDITQRKAENDLNYAIAASQARIDVAEVKHRKLLNEAEFYRKKGLPPELARDLRAVEHEIRLERDIIESKKRDFETVRAKYGADRQRYIELMRRPAPAAPR